MHAWRLRAKLRANWMALLAGPALLLAAVYFALGLRGALPAEGARVFYPAIMLYNYTAAPFSILIVLVGLTLAGLWIPQGLHRLAHWKRNGLMAAVALAAAGLACWASLPQMFATYRHIERAEVDGRVFQLGARFALDADNVVVLCDCDRLGLMCRCQHLTQAPRALDDLPRFRVDQGRQELVVEMEGQALVTIRLP
jgi:hypothetical protein